jgi:hypothetical protein
MPFSPLPLGYCTNVHPGRSLAEVEAGLDRFAVPVRERIGAPIAAGLWLADPVAREVLSQPDGPRRLADGLAQRGLVCYTLNAFPFGDFHSPRVKDGVYLPDWAQPERLEYTWNCARILAELLPDGVDGSISTLPLAFKGHPAGHGPLDRCIAQLIDLAARLQRLFDETGRRVRLAIEPEPFCRIETTDEAVWHFRRLFDMAEVSDLLGHSAGGAAAVREHIGLCYDVCHQAVEFEEPGSVIAKLGGAGVRINKVQLSCAIEVRRPGEDEAARRALAKFAEPRYLHQTFARSPSGEIFRAVDLTESLALDPLDDFREAELWRIHFHVPVDAESVGPLGTTRGELKRALAAIAALPYAPHLEIETYTWDVLPVEHADLVAGLTRELTATQTLMAASS